MINDFKKKIQKLNRNDIPAHDLMEALAVVFREEKMDLGMEVIKKDIKPFFATLKSSVTSVISSGKLFKKSENKFSQLKTNAYEKTFKTIRLLPKLKKSTLLFSKDIASDYRRCESDAEKLKYISMLLVYTASLGAGARRGFLKPAIAPALMVWTVSSLFMRTLERAQTKISPTSPSQEVVKQLAAIIQMLSRGFGMGLSTHLVSGTVFKKGAQLDFNELNGPKLENYLSGTKVDEWAYTTMTKYLHHMFEPEKRNLGT